MRLLIGAALVVALAVTGCGGSDDEGASGGAVCDALVVVDRVWRTPAPADVLGDPDRFAAYADDQLDDLRSALGELRREAPAPVVADLDRIEAQIGAYYRTSVDYVGGNPAAVPTFDAETRQALASVEAWARPQCNPAL